MRSILAGVMIVAALGACTKLDLGRGSGGARQTADQMAASGLAEANAGRAPTPKPTAKTSDALDTTTQEQRAAAAAKPVAAEQRLGKTIASLGDPTDPGFWIRTSLVSASAKGRVEDPATGKSVQVDLLPSGAEAGSGSQMSLPAMRLLGVSLTDLPDVVVYKS
jgi:hypothetical protein